VGSASGSSSAPDVVGTAVEGAVGATVGAVVASGVASDLQAVNIRTAISTITHRFHIILFIMSLLIKLAAIIPRIHLSFL
jgi:hypothetical protein